MAPRGADDSRAAVTDLLAAWRTGNEQALHQLMPLVYDELRRIARRHLRRERAGLTIQATALVNEAYVRLLDAQRVQWRDRAHFFAMASRLMRRVLVDHARARLAAKRGGGGTRVTLDDVPEPASDPAPDLLALDDALETLATVDARKARVVELRVFGGLTVEETATALDISPDTVGRDWNFAKSWLRRELNMSEQ
jgi:RNA polymerase sigma factor (TIGR02999 family)